MIMQIIDNIISIKERKNIHNYNYTVFTEPFSPSKFLVLKFA